MEEIVALCRDNYLLTLLVLYLTVGRLSLLLVVLFRLGPLAACTLLVVGCEIVQIPLFHRFYSFFGRVLSRAGRRLRGGGGKDDGGEHAPPEKVKEGFWVRRFRSWGRCGVFVLSALPFKGCGVWSGMLAGRTMGMARRPLFLLVGGAVAAGNLFVVLFGLAAREAALRLVLSLDVPPAVRSLFM